VRKIFLSSTFKDLLEHRRAAYDAIRKLEGYQCVRMEDFGARDSTPAEFCEEKVQECDIFLGLLGWFYGSSPDGSTLSFTEFEYDVATAEHMPRLMFLSGQNASTLPDLRESDCNQQKQKAFRDRVKQARIVDDFDSPADLALKIITALSNWKHVGMEPAAPFLVPRLQAVLGRKAQIELAESSLKTSHQAVVNFFGMAGVGKSAIAIELCHRLRSRYRDGVV